MHWTRSTLFLASLLCSALAGPAGAAVPASVTQEVEAHKKSAARFAAARNYPEALREIGVARERVKDASRKALGKPRRSPVDPRYRSEMKALRDWLARQTALAKQGKANMERSMREYHSRREKIEDKYRIHAYTKADEAVRKQQLADVAPFQLLLASLDDVAAGYHDARRQREPAAHYRISAAALRIQGNLGLGRVPEATAAAEQLVKLAGNDPSAYTTAGQFFQERKQWSRAAEVWKQGLRELEAKGLPRRLDYKPADAQRVRSQQMAQFYRHLAFCYQQLGQNAEMDEAIRNAQEMDRAASAAR